MSTYLLLRNNKETGPFTIEEIKRMSLKTYDLLWVEGKSAAWRYPGEIAELKSFAPPVPEQPYDRFYKKPVSESSSTEVRTIKTEPLVRFEEPLRNPTNTNREELLRKAAAQKSVYINLPASEKKSARFIPVSTPSEPINLEFDEPGIKSEIFKNPGRPNRSGSKALWISGITLLFGVGILIGYLISDRRNNYSTDVVTPQVLSHQIKTQEPKQINPGQSGIFSSSPRGNGEEQNKKAITPAESSTNLVKARKKSRISSSNIKQDSLQTAILPITPAKTPDSSKIRQDAAFKAAAQFAKVRAHPQDFLQISSGKFKVGVLGGISDLPITLTNRSGITMDLVVVTVDYVQHNKKIFKTENIFFHNVAPGTTITESAPKSSRGVNITYRLAIANSRQIDLAYSNQ